MKDFYPYPYEAMGRWPKIGLLVAEAKTNTTLQRAIMRALDPEEPDPSALMAELDMRQISVDEVRAYVDDVKPYQPMLAVQSWYI